jgi:very-short-patch-repair endonuclease
VKIWNHLRSWRSQGFHFRRQTPRCGYIADFMCLKHGLVIEIDGGKHNTILMRPATKPAMKGSAAPASVFFVSGTATSTTIYKAF